MIVSPELLLNDDRFEGLWEKWVMDNVLDEAYVIREWGSTFRTDYLKLGLLHYQFPGCSSCYLDYTCYEKFV
jgi:superfamily II DNA helicase RecQ